MIRRFALSLAALALALACGGPAERETIAVGAAASLAAAVREAADGFARARPGVEVGVHAAASGVLVRQIERGAPIDVFVSASPREVDRLAESGLVVPGTRTAVASNRLVLVVPAGGPDRVQLRDLADPTWDRIAVANPSTAPLGRYTRQALDAAGVTTAVRDRLIAGESARHVRDWVARGEVAVGIVYATDAAVDGDALHVAGEIDGATHDPVVYEAVAVARDGASPRAAELVRWLASQEGRSTLARHGFACPGSDPAAPSAASLDR
jgi:molybdate transport system substrate-binding protein